MGFNGLKALEPLEGEIFLFTTIPSTQLIETSEGWKADPVVLNLGLLDWESSVLTSRPSVYTWNEVNIKFI